MYQIACRLTSVIAIILFVILLVVPGVYTAGYGVEADDGGMFMGRRAAPMFLGLGVLAWMLRNHVDIHVQRSVSLVMIVTFAGVAVTGIWAFADGVANSVILLAALGEIFIAVVYAIVWRRA